MSEEEGLRIVPVFKSLIRPQLIAGGDRTLVITLLMCSGVLIGPGGFGSRSILNLTIGVFVLLFGLRVLNKLAKYDPQSFPIFKRAMIYKNVYLASSGFAYKSKPPKR